MFKRALDPWRWYLVLLVPSIVPALAVISRNPVGIPHAERLLIVSVGTWLVACLICVLLQRRGLTAVQSIAVAFVASVVFYWGGSVTNAFGTTTGLLIVATLVVTVGLLVARTNREPPFKIALVAVSVALLSGPVIDLVGAATTFGVNVVDDERVLAISMDEKPDVWLVVLDGHPGVPTMRLDLGATKTQELHDSLAEAGLAVTELAWSSYWATDYSLPSIVNLGYPTTEPSNSDATKRALYQIVGGDNRLTDVLAFNGYQTYMVESAWSGSACSDAIDNCIPSPWMDEPMFFMLAKSLVSDFLLSEFGYAFTAGATATMDWALDNAQSIAEDDAPSFVFAHILAPHPPFLLDENCEVVFSHARSGVTFNRADTTTSEREGYLSEQMGCVRGFVEELARRIGDDTVLVVVSDHGTDRRNQLITEPAEWGSDALVERMSVFLATSDSACDIDNGVFLPNVMRQAISCYLSDEIEDVDDRMFIGSDAEVPDEKFRYLSKHTSLILGQD